jgi:hypothetical protein
MKTHARAMTRPTPPTSTQPIHVSLTLDERDEINRRKATIRQTTALLAVYLNQRTTEDDLEEIDHQDLIDGAAAASEQILEAVHAIDAVFALADQRMNGGAK